MWWIAGRAPEWETHPLVFDCRDAAREAALVKSVATGGRPLILTAFTGRTSPFKQKDDLLCELKDKFPNQAIVDISAIQAERVYDLLGLFDSATMLISADTMHLHLSRASKVPVIALARDYPSNWNGTPPQTRFKFYCRYGEYPAKKQELLATMDKILCPPSRP